MMMMMMMISPIFVHHQTAKLTNSSHCGSARPSNQYLQYLQADLDDDDDNAGHDGGDIKMIS